MFDSQVRYWKMQLAEPLSKLDFGVGAPRAPAVRSGSSHQRMEMDSTLLASVQGFARRAQCTPFMVFVSALTMLLHLFTKEQDIRICTLVANRRQHGTESMIGYLANMVVLRNIVRPDMPGVQLLASVRDVCLAAYAHQDVPYEHVERIVQGEGERTTPPIAQVMFNFRNFPMPPQQSGGLTIASWNGENRLSNQGLLMSYIELAIHLRDASTKLTGAVNYKTDVFSEGTVTGMMRAFRAILSEIVVRPATPVGEYSSFISSVPGLVSADPRIERRFKWQES
jgi:non-ribosomal peptide synthetase component F